MLRHLTLLEGLLLHMQWFRARKSVSFGMRISYRHETETGAVYTLSQEGDLLHVRSRVPQLELRWRGERWVPERNWLEREFTYTIDVGLDEYLARFLPHLNGRLLFAGGSSQDEQSSFKGKWFNFESSGKGPEPDHAHKRILRTAADFYGVHSLFG